MLYLSVMQLLAFVDALTGGNAPPALLVQVERDWAAMALQPSTILVVAMDAHAGESWDEVGRRASAVLGTEQPEVLAGLHADAMAVVLVGSTLGPDDLARAPKKLAALNRTVQWIALSPDGRVVTTPKPASPELGEVVKAIQPALRRSVSAMSDEARVLVERRGEAELADEARFRERLKASTPPFTLAIIAACAIMFVVGRMAHANDAAALIRLGALSGRHVQRGHVELVLSYALLHGGILHIAMNGISLASVGAALENMVGGLRMVFVFVVTAAAAGVVVAFAKPDQLVVGASGGIFGVLLALFGIALRSGNEIPKLARARIRGSIRSTLIINLLISLLPGVSLLAHAAGAALGLALGMSGALTAGVSFPWRVAEPEAAARAARVFRVLGIASIVALAGSAVVAWTR